MGSTTIRAPNRAFKLGAACLALVVALLSVTLTSPPRASATCTLTASDHQYLYILAKDDIGPASGSTECDLVLNGHRFADAVRSSSNPARTAGMLAAALYEGSSLTKEQAATVVAASIYVYAPEMVSVITGTTTNPA